MDTMEGWWLQVANLQTETDFPSKIFWHSTLRIKGLSTDINGGGSEGRHVCFFPSSLCIVSVLVFKGATKPWLVTNREGWEVAAWCLASASSWSSSQSGERHCCQWRWASSRGLQGKTDPHKSVCLKDQTTEFYSPSISALMSQRRQSTRERDRERQRKSSA